MSRFATHFILHHKMLNVLKSEGKVSKESDKFFAYVLECNDGSLYKGYTRNLFERINRHLEERGAEWTAKHTPVSLIHFEEFNKEKEVLEREKYFKSGSGRVDECINLIFIFLLVCQSTLITVQYFSCAYSAKNNVPFAESVVSCSSEFSTPPFAKIIGIP